MAQQYVHPYCCVMANMPGHVQGNLYIARSFNIVRDRLRALGYRVSRVRSVWYPSGNFKGIAVVEFGASDAHCESAFKLQKMFELRGHGLADWLSRSREDVGEEPYLWVATPRDRQHIRSPPFYTEVSPILKHNATVAAEGDIFNPFDSVVAALNTLTQ